jgi:hypothetical protein
MYDVSKKGAGPQSGRLQWQHRTKPTRSNLEKTCEPLVCLWKGLLRPWVSTHGLRHIESHRVAMFDPSLITTRAGVAPAKCMADWASLHHPEYEQECFVAFAAHTHWRTHRSLSSRLLFCTPTAGEARFPSCVAIRGNDHRKTKFQPSLGSQTEFDNRSKRLLFGGYRSNCLLPFHRSTLRTNESWAT